MVNVFVFHERDHEGHMLAALIKLCDAEQRFQYLPIESPASMARMHRFVERHGLPAGSVGLPFVVLMEGDGRALLYGKAFDDWCMGLVRATCATPSMTPARITESVVAPHLAPYTLHMLRHALSTGPRPNQAAVAATAHPDPAAVDDEAMLPVGEGYADETDDAREETDGSTEMMTVATTPTKSTERPERKISVAEVMQQSNRRDPLNQNGVPRWEDK
jgi:hypothetical protein